VRAWAAACRLRLARVELVVMGRCCGCKRLLLRVLRGGTGDHLRTHSSFMSMSAPLSRSLLMRASLPLCAAQWRGALPSCRGGAEGRKCWKWAKHEQGKAAWGRDRGALKRTPIGDNERPLAAMEARGLGTAGCVFVRSAAGGEETSEFEVHARLAGRREGRFWHYFYGGRAHFDLGLNTSALPQ
jgi:hypothetical protein